MRGYKLTSTTGQVLIVGLALICCGEIFAKASIEKEPVKVTHRNSGPRYDIDDVERTRMNEADSASSNEVLRNNRPNSPPLLTQGVAGNGAGSSDNNGSDEPTTVGHISIRRIFLVPMMPPQSSSDWQPSGHSSLNERPEESSSNDQEPTSSMFGQSASRPFWPLWSPSRHHMFGGDSASRSPSSLDNMEPSASSFNGGSRGEVENEHRRPMMSMPSIPNSGIEEDNMERPNRPTMIDPIQMMINMMQEALNPASSPSGSNFFTDLNKEASANRPSGSNNDDENNNNNNRGLLGPNESPFGRPPGSNSKNETKEDIVEIDGKKYLRKTVINRHVGENIIFMTKRLIFTPLNETENNFGADSSSTPSSESTTTTTGLPPVISTSEDRRKVEEATTTTTTTTTTTGAPSSTEQQVTSTTEQPTTIISSTTKSTTTTTEAATSPSSSTSATAEETTPKTNWVDRVSDAIDRAAERLVEKSEPAATVDGASSTTTEKPKLSV